MIKSLPNSLIETAKGILGHNPRLSDVCVTKQLNAAFAINGNIRNHPNMGEYADTIFTEQEITDYKNSLLESESILIPDGDHSDMHQWLRHTEMFHQLEHPIESHVDWNDRVHANSIAHRNAMMAETHPLLSRRHLQSLNSDEIRHVNDFVHIGLRQLPSHSSGSSHINRHLLDSYKQNKSPSNILTYPSGESFDIKKFDNILHKNNLPHTLTTYSGVSFNPADEFNEHGIMTSPTFLSSSTRRATAARYAMYNVNGYDIKNPNNSTNHHILQIHSNVCDHGLYLGHNREFTDYKDDEFVHPRNRVLRIKTTPTQYHSSYNGVNRTFNIWHTTMEKKND